MSWTGNNFKLVPNPSVKDIQRFEDSFMPIPYSGCWEWLLSISGRYGMFCFNGTEYKAHRISYIIYKDSIPFGMHVLHNCDNPSCVNPDHLFLGTAKDNMTDKTIKGRGRTRGELSKCAKVSSEDVISMRQEYALGDTSYSKLAKQYGLHTATIQNIITKRTWKHL